MNETRPSTASLLAGVELAAADRAAERLLDALEPGSRRCLASVSHTITSAPARAQTSAIPEPMSPAPTTPTRSIPTSALSLILVARPIRWPQCMDRRRHRRLEQPRYRSVVRYRWHRPAWQPTRARSRAIRPERAVRAAAPSSPEASRWRRCALIASTSSSRPRPSIATVATMGGDQSRCSPSISMPWRSRTVASDTAPVGLVDDEHVADLEQAGLARLDRVAPTRA